MVEQARMMVIEPIHISSRGGRLLFGTDIFMTVIVSVSHQLGICRLHRSISRPVYIDPWNRQTIAAHSFGRPRYASIVLKKRTFINSRSVYCIRRL